MDSKIQAFGLIILVTICFLAVPVVYAGGDGGVVSSSSSSVTTDSSDMKVKLSVYYESLCPFCANFIVNYLAKAFQTDLINIIHLRLVPWGNTQISSNRSWICQHGEDECQLDVVEACAINTWPTPETHFNFIYCVERLHLMNRHSEWESCFAANGLDPKPLGNCYNNGLGYTLEKMYADETARLNPQHRFVPWVVVDDVPLQEDFQRFEAYICKSYRGRKIPEACKAASFETTALETPFSMPQVCKVGEIEG